MTILLDSTGLTVQTYNDILEEIVVSLTASLSLTATQADRVRASVSSSVGQLARVEAEREALMQEAMLNVYDSLSITSVGSQLDRVVRLLGITRDPATQSRVTGTAAGTAGTPIPAGIQLRYNPESTIWTVEADTTIGGGGTVALAVLGPSGDAITAALDPDTGFDDWTIVDTVIGFSDVGSFESSAQTVIGEPIETDAAVRGKAEQEAFKRGTGPLVSLEAEISDVDGVTYVKAWDNTTTDPGTVDSDDIPARAINIVVEGGADADIIAAILRKRPAGAQLYGTSVTSDEDLGNGRIVRVAFDRVASVPIWIEADAVSSTSEEPVVPGLTDLIAARLLEQGPLLFGIGDDVLPVRLAASTLDITGFDDITVTLSLDDGATDPYSTTKRSISVRERPTFDAARITVTES